MRTIGLTWEQAKNLLKSGLCKRVTYNCDGSHPEGIFWELDKKDRIVRGVTGSSRSDIGLNPMRSGNLFKIIE